MELHDFLGVDGRDSVNACVKVAIFRKLREYTEEEAYTRLCGCFQNPPVNLLPLVLTDKDINGEPKKTYSIMDIRKALCDLIELKDVEACSNEGLCKELEQEPSKELEQEINYQRQDIETEYQKYLSIRRDEKVDINPEEAPESNKSSNEEGGRDEAFSASVDADGRKHSDDEVKKDEVKNNNFAESIPVNDLDTVPIDTSNHTSDILDHEVYHDNKNASDDEKYPIKESGFNCGLKQEKNASFSSDEIDHGSGFIISDNLVVTNKHVIQDAIDDETLEIRISNAVIGVLTCEVVRSDPNNDLALLRCRNLNLNVKGICPLELSEEAPLLGMSIFTFGYPVTHTGKTALFVKGYVAGSVDRFAREPLIVLNCPVNHGNSGGPVIYRIKGELKVVAVLVQRHKKEIMTAEERYQIEKLRQSLQTSSNEDLKNSDIMLWKLLTLKLIDALETHCQFNLCNAVPGRLVVDFIHGVKYDEECKKSE